VSPEEKAKEFESIAASVRRKAVTKIRKLERLLDNLRADLEKIRMNCDPEGNDHALDRMVLVGHSMGGLVSRLQTTKSGDQFWNLVSSATMRYSC